MGMLSHGNRTGLAAGDRFEAMLEGTEDLVVKAPGDDTGIAETRIEAAKDAEGIGSMPPPASAKQLGKAAMAALVGGSPDRLLDKLSERLAFERNGVRLYTALVSKRRAYGAFAGGPSIEDLEHIGGEELEHMHLLTTCIEKLGADPTVISPSADVVSVTSRGITETVVDARTNLQQSLEAVLVAELADNDGWDALIALAHEAGQKAMVESFENAIADEREHLRRVRAWVAAGQGRARPPEATV